MGSTKQAVGLLGGSFDPVHNGHLSIARSFLDSDFISSLWVLLTPEPPHKIEQTQASYPDRLKMLELAFDDWAKVVISDVETHLPTPSYTLQTVQYLSEEHPDKQFYLCIGEDSAYHFTDWHKWKQILDYCDLLVAHRPSDDALELHPKVAKKAHIIDHEPIDISSTEVRTKLTTGQDISDLVPSSVRHFIKQDKPYKIS